MNEPVQQMLLGDAVEHAALGVLVWNADHRYVAVNAKACDLLGVTREQLLGRPMGSTNRSGEARSLIDRIIERAPAQGVIEVRGAELGWLVFPTRVAGLEHMVGLMWEVAAL